MSLGIEYKPFNKLVKKIIDNRGKTCPVVPSGFPLIATNCILNSNLYPVFENIRFVSQETYETWFRGHPEPGDMIFILKGTPGRVNWVPDPVSFCIAQDMVAIRANEQEIYPKYLFATLRSSIIQQEIENLHVGTLIPHFKKSDFDKLFIPCPSYKIQTYIGDTYFYFSQKIDLLQRQNTTLEAMAETLFRQWFIEEAQEAWGEQAFGNIVTFHDSKRIPLSKTEREKMQNGLLYPYYGAAQIVDYVNNFIFNGDYLLIAEDGTVRTDSGTPVLQRAYGKFWVNNHTHVITATYPYNNDFLYILLLRRNIDELITGAVQPKISQSNLRKLSIPYYPVELVKKYIFLTKDIFSKIRSNQKQIRTLEKLRDTLLPKLMSGEVRVRVNE